MTDKLINRPSADDHKTTHTHTQKHTHTLAERKLIDKRNTSTHAQPDREVYIISLGGQPEQTQSFNFHESLGESERGRKRGEEEEERGEGGGK